MADADTRERIVKQRWAEPGSGHDRIVRWTKILLPSAVGVLVAVLALAPLDKKGDVSFILDKKKVQSAPERMRVEAARYTGTDDKGQLFEIIASRAIQRTSDTPLVDINGMFARLNQTQGPVLIAADKGRYNLDTQRVAIDGPVKVAGGDGFRLNTSNVLVDLNDRQLASQGPAEGAMRLGQFRANRVRADLGDHKVVLDGGARLKIVQGAVR
ncbi:MAG: LPS export ABC transporter periplasmic protein LptC [Sphingomicrobium sp.]